MTSAAPPSVRRVFLGGGGPPLAAAAAWLREELGTDGTGAVVALPGARAARHLRLRLARLVGDHWLPPRFVTAGGLTDVLLGLNGAPADRLVRTLAWRRALEGLPEPALRRLAARPPEAGDLAGWMRLAEEVRGLFGELAAEGLDFRAVAASDQFPAGAPGEQERWKSLAAAQERMVEELAAAGRVDPHLSRLEAIDARRGSDVRRVVLIGVADTNDLLRQALSVTDAEVTALVFAPEEEAQAFDELGRILPEAWIQRGVELPLDCWHVVDGPDQQAARALAVAARWAEESEGGALPSDELALGIADADVVPHLERRLAAIGAVARDAAGVPFRRTAPARLLIAAADALDSGGFLEVQELARHPAVDRVLARGRVADPVALLARYQRDHLPDSMPSHWAPAAKGQAELAALDQALRELLGELFDGQARPLRDWVPVLRAFLVRVHERGDEDAPEDRVVLAALGAIGQALDGLAALPPALDAQATASEALRLLASASASDPVPPAPAAPGEASVELLGWLELPLDDAPALIVTGFEEGRVPESRGGDTYLPNRLRRDLGLIDDDRRLARDVYATALLLRTRRQVAFVTGRRSRSGDPQLPSRVVFHTTEAAVLERVRHFLAAAEVRPVRAEGRLEKSRELLRGPELAAPESFAVTAFRDFLESPYLFYLRHVMQLRTLDDRARELDGRGFGILAHRVAEVLLQHPEEQDADALAQLLVGQLRDEASRVFGAGALPAVQLQIEQLARRLELFAEAEAAHRAKGWRIEAVELDRSFSLEVDGEAVEVRGRIDRLDRNVETGGWAVWDVKTSEEAKRPGASHRTPAGHWRDLQLPLYSHLVRTDTGGEVPALGYVNISRSGESAFGFQQVDRWGTRKETRLELDQGVEEALEEARRIVRVVRDRDWFRIGSWSNRDVILKELAGVELVGSSEEEEL